jgi:hypothetical protein
VVAGGLEGYARSAGAAAAGAPGLGRDALAALLGRLPLPPPPPGGGAGPPAAPALQQLLPEGGLLEGGEDSLGLDSDDEAAAPGGWGAQRDGGASGGGSTWLLPRAAALDVRRHDERTLYGAIPGALHIPGEAAGLTSGGGGEVGQLRGRGVDGKAGAGGAQDRGGGCAAW